MLEVDHNSKGVTSAGVHELLFLQFEHLAHVADVHLGSSLGSPVLVDDKDVLRLRELHDQSVESVGLNADLLDVRSVFAEFIHNYLHVSLNCLIMLAIFSYFRMSFLPSLWKCPKIKKVDRSKRAASWHSEFSQISCSVDSILSRLGMSSCTICDQAWQRVSSQMLVAKNFLTFTLHAGGITEFIWFFFFSKASCLLSSGILSILWIKMKIAPFQLYSSTLLTARRQYSRLFLSFSSGSSMSKTQMTTSTFLKIVSRCTMKQLSMKVSWPPQSHRLKVKLPINFSLCSFLSTVQPIL